MAFPQLQEEGRIARIDEYAKAEQSFEEEKKELGATIEKLSSQLDEENERKVNLLKEIRQLRERIETREDAHASVQKLIPLLKSLKAVKKEESVLQSNYDAECSQLQAEINQLEGKIGNSLDDQTLSEDLDNVLAASVEKLDSTKKDLAARLRAVLLVKQQIDKIPTQSELIQYEHRFSELNVHIQEKHRQTCKYYATYNALLEIKDLMLKETSLLNSISSQFQNAITSIDGGKKLIDSMDGIVKGSQQKLQKVGDELQEEQKTCDSLKKKYAAAMAEQRHCYSVLKSFQAECAKNERLQNQISTGNNAAA